MLNLGAQSRYTPCWRCFLALLLMSGLLSQPLHARDVLRDEVRHALNNQGLAGASWGIVESSQSRADAVGMSNAEAGIPLQSHQQVQVGSITKTLMALGTLTLVTDGQLQLDTPVAELLPQIQFVNPWRDSHPIRVRDLLNHTAGLQNLRLWHLLNTRATPDSPLDEVYQQDPELLRVTTPPGEYFHYSNLGYNLLAMVIEQVTQQRYEQALQERLLRPLGMSQSHFYLVTQEGSDSGFNTSASLAYGHLDHKQLIASQPSYLRAAGQFTTTPGDMIKLMRFLLGTGEVNGKLLVAPQYLQAMGDIAPTLSQRNGLEAGGQFGLWRRDRYGVVGKCHGGNTLGFQSMMCLFPERQKAFFVAVNSDKEIADYESLYQLFIKHLAIPPAPEAKIGPMPPQVDSGLGWYRLFPEFFSFAYLDRIFNVVHISRKDGGLVLWSPTAAARYLAPLEIDPSTESEGLLFSAQNRRTASHVLFTDAAGEPVLSSGFGNYKRFSPVIWGAMVISLLLGLLGFAYIAIRGLYLVFTVKGQFVKEPVGISFLMLPALLIPVPFLLQQSFMQMGNLNLASGLLAGATALAALLCIPALLPYVFRKRSLNTDFYAILAFFQWALVLAYWGLLPLQLWRI